AYIDIPKEISSKEVLENGCNLSSNAYKKLLMKNANFKILRELLARDLKRSDLGVEVGSLSYVPKSPFTFMRAKALQEYSFLPEITDESLLYILPQSFVNMDLKKGDVIISKDSNIGEIVILEKDYPNTMLSGAMYKLPLAQHKYYILAVIKHRIFRDQLDFIVPKGATIRHAKQLFLECKIPFPNYNVEQTIAFIETLVQSIIIKEKLIKERHTKILNLIESELLNNQKSNAFCYAYPTFKELQESGRLDTGIYCEEFKKIDFLIKNYKNDYQSFSELNLDISRGQNLQESCIGKSIYSDIYQRNFYSLALPPHFSQYGTINKMLYFGNSNTLKILKQGEIVFGAEGTFRSIVVIGEVEKFITNIHGITLYKNDLTESIFIKLFMDFLTEKRFIDFIKVGGHGG
ncbi:MAG: hypothetical protein K2G68_03550, partial [Helicobacter sp.]|nr:hypothetical protein [Helicobacter sp.]